MQLRDLAWLLTVADERHVTGAAAILGIHQPTLSRAVARVEEELGAQLLNRRADGVTLTPLGELAVEAARDIVARHDRLLADLAGELDPEAGVVRLAFLDSMASSLVPRLLHDFHEMAPRVRVELRQEPSHVIEADLDSAAVDVAITSRPPRRRDGWHPLLDERLVVIVPAGHRLAARRALTPSDLAEEELVTTPPGYGHRALVDGLLAAGGVSPRISFESQDLATIEGLVAAGLGVAVVTEAFAGLSGTVGIRLRAAGAHRRIGLIWRTDRVLSAPAARFRDFVVARSGPLGP